jgi:putative restriction endonuclease
MAGLTDLTDPDAVRSAMAEFDEIGREAFLTKYGFRPARSFFVIHNGTRYDSKAIVGAAYGYQHPQRGPMAGRDFIGGDATVRPKLEALGFLVVSDNQREVVSTSHRLELRRVYPREKLIEMFSIVDATVNTGVFRPAGSKSLWLFVTRDKTSDRTQYADRLDGDLLHWEGQTSGRTDRRIVDHEARGDELLVFYRTSKREHPKAGFRYEGAFRYLSHQAGKPSRFLLQRVSALDDLGDDLPTDPFDPKDVEDGRKTVLTAIVRRQGQAAFRRSLIHAYGGRCAVTGCTVEPLLEAAHIRAYFGPETNHVTNGILLRADIHTLFDLGLIWIDEGMRVVAADRLTGTDYAFLNGRKLMIPQEVACRPSGRAIGWHREIVGKK